MSDLYEELKEAERVALEGENALRRAQRKILEVENKLRGALHVGTTSPCSVGVLPNGKIAVHVLSESPVTANPLYIVDPQYITEDGQPRKKFIDEKLGC